MVFSEKEFAGVVKPKEGTTMAIIKRKYRTKKQQKPITFYQAEVFIKGVRIAVKNFSTKREAVFWHEKEKYKFTLSPTTLNDRMRFKDCLSRFWKDVQGRTLKSTHQSYEFRLENYLNVSPLGDMKMSEIKGIHVVEWVQWLKKHPTAKNKRRKSFVKELCLLKLVLEYRKNKGPFFLNEEVFNSSL